MAWSRCVFGAIPVVREGIQPQSQIRLDPSYALAFAGRSQALTGFAQEFATGSAIRESFEKAQRDARHAIALAPKLADGHLALAVYLEAGSLDFTQAI